MSRTLKKLTIFFKFDNFREMRPHFCEFPWHKSPRLSWWSFILLIKNHQTNKTNLLRACVPVSVKSWCQRDGFGTFQCELSPLPRVWLVKPTCGSLWNIIYLFSSKRRRRRRKKSGFWSYGYVLASKKTLSVHIGNWYTKVGIGIAFRAPAAARRDPM